MVADAALKKARIELLRWSILLTLNAARPLGATDVLIVHTVSMAISDVSLDDVRIELDYLHKRSLVKLDRDDYLPNWRGELTQTGIDVVEHTVPCDPGIARPARYFK